MTGGWISNEHIKFYLDVNVGSSKPDLQYAPLLPPSAL